MTEKLIEAADLGAGWVARAYGDGSFSISHYFSGERVDLNAESAKAFVNLWRDARDARQSTPSSVEG